MTTYFLVNGSAQFERQNQQRDFRRSRDQREIQAFQQRLIDYNKREKEIILQQTQEEPDKERSKRRKYGFIAAQVMSTGEIEQIYNEVTGRFEYTLTAHAPKNIGMELLKVGRKQLKRQGIPVSRIKPLSTAYKAS